MNTQPSKALIALKEVLAFLRTRIFEVYVFVVSLFVGAAILVYYQWTKKPEQVRGLLRFWSGCFIYGAKYILGINFRIEGQENIPAEPVIFMGNHQTYWESVAMTEFFPNINVVTKRSAMAIPVFGWGLKYAPMIPVDRETPGKNIRRILKDGKISIQEGRSILMFPEGSRVPIGEIRPFVRGFEMLYKYCNTNVVPFVTDAGRWWPVGFATKRPGTITIRFLPYVEPGKDADEFAVELERVVRHAADELMGAQG